MDRSSEAYVWQLFVDAYEAKQVEAVRAELQVTLKALQAQPQFVEMLKNPTMAVEAKKQFMESTFADQVSNLLIAFLKTLVAEDALDYLEEIEDLYNQVVGQYLEDYLGIVEGKVYSAIPLTDFQLGTLAGVFKRVVGKQVRFTVVIDESLIGGYRVAIKNQVYDNTIKLQLKQLRESLMNADLE